MADKKPNLMKKREISDLVFESMKIVARDEKYREDQLKSYAEFVYIDRAEDWVVNEIKTFLEMTPCNAYAVVFDYVRDDDNVQATKVVEVNHVTYHGLEKAIVELTDDVKAGHMDVVVLSKDFIGKAGHLLARLSGQVEYSMESQ
ncbi:MAG: hypothetical protein GOU99_01710 [Candidatus Altiarchaeota archaeon]|nr:hypothetical protein [Candidatus Altiarchaeota archaeon]